MSDRSFVPVGAQKPDVLFVGAGVSAMVAAVELLAAGRTVAIYERRSRADYGGQCNWAFGGFFFADSPEQRRFGVKDSAELAWQDWQSYAEFEPGSEPQQLWAKRLIERGVADVHDWMTGRGMRFFPSPNWAERAAHGRGNRVPRFHLLWGCGPELTAHLREALRRYEGNRLQLFFDHDVTGLDHSAGAVTGVRGHAPDGTEFTAAADHVVIAAGGFTGNLERVRAHWPQAWHRPPGEGELLHGVWPEMDGRMHDAAAERGAALVDLSNMWVYAAGVTSWRSDMPQRGDALIPMKSSLWMRADGSRFDPPLLAGYDTREAVARISAQAQPWSWAVLNRKVLVRELAIQGSDFNPAFRDKNLKELASFFAVGSTALAQELIDRCPDVVSAPTVHELAAKMNRVAGGVDAAALERDIAAYDREVDAGKKFYTDDQLVSLRAVRAFLADRIRTTNFAPIRVPGVDLVAIRYRLTVRKSLGGILTDGACRALTPAGEVIPGLSAIGEAAGFGGGGMNGKRTLEGTLLSGCVLTARELARHL